MNDGALKLCRETRDAPIEERKQVFHTSAQRYAGAIPAWILGSSDWGYLTPTARLVLQSLCSRGEPDARYGGSIVSAFGGKSAWEGVGISRSSFFRGIRKLEQFGFAVTMSRGGIVHFVDEGGQRKTRNAANSYGVPSERGALNRYRVDRETRVMRKRGDGKYAPETIRPGEQAALWGAATDGDARDCEIDCETHPEGCDIPCENGSTACQSDTGGVSERHGGSCQTDTLPHHNYQPIVNEHVGSHAAGHRPGNAFSSGPANSVARRATTRSGSARLGHIPSATNLRSIAWLRHYREPLGGSGLAGPDEKAFVACACKALRIGKNPPAMFVDLLRRMAKEGDPPVELGDHAEAQRMIRAMEESRQGGSQC